MSGGVAPWPGITSLQAKTIGALHAGGPLGPTLPDWVVTDSSAGGTVSQQNDGPDLSTDATASEYASAFMASRPNNVNNGLLIGRFIWAVNQAQADLAESYEIGFARPQSNDGDDAVVLRPHVGDSTAGNIRVDDGGVDNDGTLNYPTVMNKWHVYSIVVDFDAGETRFHVDSNPLSDQADATISAVPDNIQPPGAKIFSGQTDAAETLTPTFIEYIYVP